MASPAQFLSEVRSELKKVIWPTRQELIRLTALVIGISLVVGIYVGGLDLIFTKLMEVVLKR
ncbi:preprotein translocase subunit SecE [Candidatus Microgenomates bacterium]|nr:preprotein translocase subunit SecE [Candidatus Microgenomates bacterium]